MTTKFSWPGACIRITVFLFIAACSGSAFAQKKKAKKSSAATPAELVLAESKQSRYRIIIPSSATADEERAAEVLQSHLLEISGAALPIVKTDKSRSPYEIVLGQNERLDELKTNINFNELREDGFIIKTDSSRLIIAGGSEKGTLYGVYSFL